MNNARHLSIFDPTDYKDKKILIVGCGNIGSHTATHLVRMGFENIVLYDFDVVEDVNICTQDFTTEDMGKEKTQAVKDKLLLINPDATITTRGEFTADSLEEIVSQDLIAPLALISAVDSIEIRQAMKEILINSDIADVPVIDGRIGREQVEVLYAQTPEQWDVIIPEEMNAETACTEKYIAYTPTMCATLIAISVKKLCTGDELFEDIIFDFVTLSLIKTHGQENTRNNRQAP
jgi:molybdopterin/thiamine biosynthesis adenylyltransferase